VLASTFVEAAAAPAPAAPSPPVAAAAPEPAVLDRALMPGENVRQEAAALAL